MIKKIFLFMPLLVLDFALIIIKLFLNNNELELMSYIYYMFLLVNFIYVIAYSLYLLKNNKDKALFIVFEVIIFLTIFCSMKLLMGNDIRINENIVKTKYATRLQEPKFGYRYVNWFVRGNREIECRGKLCNYQI